MRGSNWWSCRKREVSTGKWQAESKRARENKGRDWRGQSRDVTILGCRRRRGQTEGNPGIGAQARCSVITPVAACGVVLIRVSSLNTEGRRNDDLQSRTEVTDQNLIIPQPLSHTKVSNKPSLVYLLCGLGASRLISLSLSCFLLQKNWYVTNHTHV